MSGDAPGATLQLVPLYPDVHTHTACSTTSNFLIVPQASQHISQHSQPDTSVLTRYVGCDLPGGPVRASYGVHLEGCLLLRGKRPKRAAHAALLWGKTTVCKRQKP